MKKLLKTSIALAAAVVMLCAGIYAAIINQVGFNMNNYVYFNAASNVHVDIKGKITGGAMDTETARNYQGATYRTDEPTISVDAMPWRIGGVAFIVDNGSAIIKYTLEFTNAGEADVDIVITIPTDLADALVLTGGLDNSGTIEEGVHIATIEKYETVKFVYTLELTDLTHTLADTDVSFIVSLFNTIAD